MKCEHRHWPSELRELRAAGKAMRPYCELPGQRHHLVDGKVKRAVVLCARHVQRYERPAAGGGAS